ncbi:hypothetical protein [Desulfovibrio sp. JC010]|uniref:hypothetical protein n=1 Tax=Desulfovibrio sp. JC010 TaxID=2593641 RepID=UPI0013CFAED2|nr:hypothetical protein [Desulfovibrio sp. JC010]NDV26688.1 hypothetical protein [Desulfovibrio sp. JC010]
MLIGIDLDNTIICYDNSLHGIAVERGLISSDLPKEKRVIRDQIRAVHDDIEWQKLQIAIYGTHMEQAELMPGARDFLLQLKNQGIKFQIVSHKTRYPNYGDSKVDLHVAARAFLKRHNFFSESGLGLNENDVFFLPTRSKKIKTIRQLKHNIFIDDLKELYLEADFPQQVTKILFSSEQEVEIPGVIVLPDFTKISEFVFKGIADGRF